MSKKQNLVVGSHVVFDFGRLWRGFREEFQEQEHAKAKEANRFFYGRTGVVVDYDQSEHKILVRMDDDGSTDWHYRGDVNVTALPTDKADETAAEIRDLLREILEHVAAIRRDR